MNTGARGVQEPERLLATGTLCRDQCRKLERIAHHHGLVEQAASDSSLLSSTCSCRRRRVPRGHWRAHIPLPVLFSAAHSYGADCCKQTWCRQSRHHWPCGGCQPHGAGRACSVAVCLMCKRYDMRAGCPGVREPVAAGGRHTHAPLCAGVPGRGRQGQQVQPSDLLAATRACYLPLWQHGGWCTASRNRLTWFCAPAASALSS